MPDVFTCCLVFNRNQLFVYLPVNATGSVLRASVYKLAQQL
jgi:hypothetical protein